MGGTHTGLNSSFISSQLILRHHRRHGHYSRHGHQDGLDNWTYRTTRTDKAERTYRAGRSDIGIDIDIDIALKVKVALWGFGA